ncbi:hypothetical protein FVEN_g13033 [Fusarium venenatum]|nr:hypothetical protein FVEN_g13033 [Fusarium venenatum]
MWGSLWRDEVLDMSVRAACKHVLDVLTPEEMNAVWI